MPGKKLFITVVFVLCFIIGISYPITVKHLIVDEPPVTSDVIIVAKGGSNRSQKAAKLLFDGYSESGKIIVSPITESNAQLYRKAGVTQEQIIPETEATSTYTNAIYTLEIMKEQGFESAIVVTSDLHTRRMSRAI